MRCSLSSYLQSNGKINHLVWHYLIVRFLIRKSVNLLMQDALLYFLTETFFTFCFKHQEAAGRCLVELASIYRGHVSYNSTTDSNEDEDVVDSDENAKRPESVLLAKSLAILDIFEG